VLATDPDPSVRELLVRLLAAIAGPEGTEALVFQALREDDAGIRRAAAAALARRRDPEAVPLLIRRLKGEPPQAIGRAAEALAGLGATEAVPDLIDALVRVERRPVLVRSMRPAAAPAPVSGMSMSGSSVPVLTGPVVGNGVVAYGATSVPYGSGVGLNMGSGGYRPGPPRLRMMTRVERHPEVLAALESLTGRNFGFDQASWRRWQATQARPTSGPSRRVPQP